ncbi:MAG: hypothetical protein JW925_03620 [Syntrophaceae bacterium]|nr:hypothetical protein [Syntrophaceae bacterium]
MNYPIALGYWELFQAFSAVVKQTACIGIIIKKKLLTNKGAEDFEKPSAPLF